MIIRKGTLVLRTNYISNYHTVVDDDNGLGVGTGFYWCDDPVAGGTTGTGIFWQVLGPNTLGNHDAGSTY